VSHVTFLTLGMAAVGVVGPESLGHLLAPLEWLYSDSSMVTELPGGYRFTSCQLSSMSGERWSP
jgi:hypothetical protein